MACCECIMIKAIRLHTKKIKALEERLALLELLDKDVYSEECECGCNSK